MIPPDHPTGSPAEEDHESNAYLAIAAAPCAISPVTGVMLARSGKLGSGQTCHGSDRRQKTLDTPLPG